MSEIARRYALALFHLAEQQAKVELWQADLKRALDLFEAKPALLKLCYSLPLASSCQLIERCLAVQIELRHFFWLLLKRRRLPLFSEICTAYTKLADAKLGKLAVHLITARPLDEQAESQLQNMLESKWHKKIYFTRKLQPALLAGALLMIGYQSIDASLQGKLLRLKKHLLRERMHEAAARRNHLGD